MKRPMLYWVILFVLGEVFFDRIPTALIIVIALCYFAAVYTYGKFSIDTIKKQLLIIGGLFFVFGVVCSGHYRQKLLICDIGEGSSVSFTGTVIERQDRYDNRYRVRLRSLNGKRIYAYLVLETDGGLYPGLTISGKGKVKRYMTATNPGQFDQKAYELSKGNVLLLEETGIYSAKRPLIGLRRMLAEIRKKLALQFELSLDAQDASLAKAMVLGDKGGLDQDIRALYQRNGIAHLIAISGLHIAMLGGTIYRLVRRLSGSFTSAAGIGITFIIMYGILTGLSGATVRAMIMLIMAIVSDVLGRKYDALTAISTALLIMLIANPGQLLQAGFMLSFGAVIGIACVYPVLNYHIKNAGKDVQKKLKAFNKKNGKNVNDPSGKKKRRNIFLKLWDVFLVSASVQITLIPILLWYFYEIPVYSVFLNIIVVPAMSVLLFALIILSVSGVVIGNVPVVYAIVARIMTAAAGLIFDIYEKLCKITEMLPYHSLCVGRPHKWWVFSYYILLASLLMLTPYGKKRYIAVVVSLFILLMASVPFYGKLMVTMFDVGQGDGLYVKTPGNNNILIDGGSSSMKNVGTYVLKNGIKYYGGKHLDYIIVTHSDSDHYSGVLELLNDPDIYVDCFVLPAITNPDEAYQKLAKTAENKGCRLCYIKTGDVFNTGDVTFRCLNPEQISYGDKNSGSIVLWMQYRSFDMLFTGDMDSLVEDKLLGCRELTDSIISGNSMEVLKVAHHGSATASSDKFLEQMRFSVSLVSVGERNRYGHPAPEVMERLRMYCKHIYLTKDSGAVTIETDGKKYSIQTFVSKGQQ